MKVRQFFHYLTEMASALCFSCEMSKNTVVLNVLGGSFIRKGQNVTRLAPVLQCQLPVDVSFITQPFALFKLLITRNGNRSLNKTPYRKKKQLFFRALSSTWQRLEISTVLVHAKKNIPFCCCKEGTKKQGGAEWELLCVRRNQQKWVCSYWAPDPKSQGYSVCYNHVFKNPNLFLPSCSSQMKQSWGSVWTGLGVPHWKESPNNMHDSQPKARQSG